MNTISIDIGFGYIKAVNQNGSKCHFPTIIYENNYDDIMGESNHEYAMAVNGQRYYFGELAQKNGSAREMSLIKQLHHHTEDYVAFCCYQLTDENPTQAVHLCLGLPYSYYVEMNKGDKLVELLIGRTFQAVSQAGEKQITIEQVSVYPQGVGAYFSNLYDTSGESLQGLNDHLQALFIDIGFRTVDVVAFESLNGAYTLIHNNSFSLEKSGISSALNAMTTQANQIVKTIDYSPNDIEYAIQNSGSILHNQFGDYDISEIVSSEYRKLAQKIFTQINIKLGDNLFKYPNIYLSGGGATQLLPYMKEQFPSILLQGDSIFSNATGYLVIHNLKNRG